MSDFEKQIHAMFDHIWDCDINHPIFEDTVGELMDAVIQCYNSLPSSKPEPSTEIQEILNYLDTILHPIVSPDNWNVYSKLHDMVSGLLYAQPDTWMEQNRERILQAGMEGREVEFWIGGRLFAIREKAQ